MSEQYISRILSQADYIGSMTEYEDAQAPLTQEELLEQIN